MFTSCPCVGHFSSKWPIQGLESNDKISYFEMIERWIKSWNFQQLFICSHVCAKLTTKFLLLLNQPAINRPFHPKFWKALVTVFVGIFFRKNFWWGSRPIPVTHWKEFWISWKKWRFQIFQKLAGLITKSRHNLNTM